MDPKKVKVVLNTAGTAVDANNSTVEDAGVTDYLKQGIPFLKDEDVAIIGSSAGRTVTEVGLLLATMWVGERFAPIGRLRDAVA